jgi:serine/threonine protein phosphatase 1
MDNLIQTFKLNQSGRDYIAGDIHGCFDELQTKLNEIGFNTETDRLFSVGDLIDRGDKSEEVVKWLNNPWFHAVRGNHEQMAIETFYGDWDSKNYYINGGAWFLSLVPEEQRLFVDIFESMPILIEVQTKTGLVGIVHAEYPYESWDLKDSYTGEKGLKNFTASCLWSRDRVSFNDNSVIDGISRIYVGHTPVEKPVTLGNTTYIDTGAVFGYGLTVIEI